MIVSMVELRTMVLNCGYSCSCCDCGHCSCCDAHCGFCDVKSFLILTNYTKWHHRHTTLFIHYSRVSVCSINTDWEVLKYKVKRLLKVRLKANMFEIVLFSYITVVHVIKDNTAIVVQCGCGNYCINNIAAAIIDVNCNLKQCSETPPYNLPTELPWWWIHICMYTCSTWNLYLICQNNVFMLPLW
jgi:hypothetical protein